jgi:hypothetical protein
MANRLLKPMAGCLEAGVVKLYGSFTTSTSGTIASSSCKGFSVAKTSAETGRYTVTLADTWYALLHVSAVIAGTTDAAMTTGAGISYFLRNVSVADSTPTFDIQFCSPDGSPADAELEDAASVYIEITLKNSSAY